MILQTVACKLRRQGYKNWLARAPIRNQLVSYVDDLFDYVHERWPDSLTSCEFLVDGSLEEFDSSRIGYVPKVDRNFLTFITDQPFDIAWDRQYGSGDVHTAIFKAGNDAIYFWEIKAWKSNRLRKKTQTTH